MKIFHVLLTLFGLMFCAQGAQATVNLTKDQLDRVYAATLEVVVKKIEHDSLSYEKPLPMDLIPFQIRNDKYWSLGTAFAIGPDTFVSAAHVFNLDVNSLYRDFYLRDKNGKVYVPDKIHKFAGNRDFIVFSVKDLQIKNHLETNTAPAINNRVYAVGNAHGEGIVIRDGLYTSDTPEDLDGAWQWMRFSAAASPGNSGGPLLDKDGRVVGIVLRKSENENLNYALPIREVLEAPEQAVHDSLIAYGLENLNAQKTGRFSYQQDLPLSFPDLNRDLTTALDKFYTDLFNQLLAEHEQKTFPRGEGSDYLLHKTYTAFFPHIISLRDDGNWLPTRPESIQRADLGKNGFLQYGKLGATLLFRIHKPDGQNLKSFLNDGKQSMDYLLKALGYKRTIGSEEIRVTSLGKPVLETTHRDRFGRSWTIRKWITEFDDSAVVTMSLPTPGGNISMLRGDSVGIIDSHLLDMKSLADFVYLSYYGTLQEWSEFLALGDDRVPDSLQNLALDYGSGKQLKFASRDIVFNYDASLQAISDDSDLRVYMSYFRHDDKVVWDIARVAIGEHKDNLNYFEVARNLRPSERMSDSDKSGWERLVQQEFPFNKTSYFKDKSTYIGMVYTNGQNSANLQQQPSLFSIFYGREGKIEQAEIASKLEAVVKNLDIVD